MFGWKKIFLHKVLKKIFLVKKKKKKNSCRNTIRKVTHENFGKFMNIEFEFIKLFDRFMYLRFDQVEKLHKSRNMENV